MPLEKNNSTTVTIKGVEHLYFGGTNYLGLAHRPELMRAAEKAFDKYGFSAGASRVTSGESELLLELEQDLSAFAESESALALPAGYMSNAAVVEGLDDIVDTWVVQKTAHSSIKSALQASKKRVIVDDTMNAETIRTCYNLKEPCRLAIFAEPIDAMTGALFDLKGLVDSTRAFDFVIIDEAHSFAVLGNSGRGAVEHFGLGDKDRIIRTGTFSKAIGSYGGFVLASKTVIDRIKQYSSNYRASTALSPLAVAAARESLRLIRDDSASTTKRLQSNIKFLNENLVTLGLDYKTNCVPIYYLKSSEAVKQIRDSLSPARIYIPTSTGYFADYCETGLRWTIQSGHTQAHLTRLITVLSQHLQPVS